ncbi:cupin domain-containing protein [Halobacteriovorax sp. GB3]|uniref:cupin domain-containing protein n=1 Tax=Halobacteriovorax sp. GB3 TaxID=2719615 RepID=UPI00236204BF|nr:cupin domain-containing protein [Halobacteriovorax sp. GB3]MDD0851733.1 cupin domain-containing protein [Halobacteriovorax sp. GB3]
MKDTSFGRMRTLDLNADLYKLEHLIFEREGRFHSHLEDEYVYVLSGQGVIETPKENMELLSGMIQKIPAKTAHRMIPESGKSLECLIWYRNPV